MVRLVDLHVPQVDAINRFVNTSSVHSRSLPLMSRDDVKADLKTRAGAVSQALRESSDSLLAEVSDTGAEALDRIRQTGTDAVSAARERAKSS